MLTPLKIILFLQCAAIANSVGFLFGANGLMTRKFLGNVTSAAVQLLINLLCTDILMTGRQAPSSQADGGSATVSLRPWTLAVCTHEAAVNSRHHAAK